MLRNGNKYLLMLVRYNYAHRGDFSQSRTSFIPPQDRGIFTPAEQP